MVNLSKLSPDAIPTKGQIKCLRAFRKFEKKHGRPPTQRELSEAMGLTESGSAFHIKACVEKGFFTPPQVVKVMKLTPEGERWV